MSELLVKKIKVLYVAKRRGHSDIYNGVFTCYSNEITKAKRPHGGGRATLIIYRQCLPLEVMAKQMTNWVNILKLPDDKYPQTGRETL
jgi:hypothetical protein